MNVNEILITISQSSILITEITYKNTLGSTLKNNERTHLPLVNMDWANCRIKPHHRSTGGGRSTQRSVFPARLWTALRVQVSSSPLSARSWLVDGSSATPALAFGVFLSLFHVFPRSWAFASFLGPYFMGKIWIFRTTYCVATLGSVSLVSSSTRVLDFICCEGSRVTIAGSPPDHPLQSLDHPTAPHGWPRGNRPIAARRGPFIGIGGSPFDSPDDVVQSSDGDCRISVRWPADFFRYISDGGPPIAARWSDGVPRAAARWGKVGRNRPIIRQILTAS